MELYLQNFENWLRMDRLTRISDKLRARAIYVIALLLVASQIVNMMLMAHSYGGWTLDHWISFTVTILFLGSIIALRYTKKFYIFASFYSLMMIAGILGTAVMDYTGINSALLPFMLFGSVVCGFISGWRMVLAYGAMVCATVFILHNVSAGAPMGALYDPDLFAARNFQRAAQMYLVLGLVTAVAGFASYSMHSAFFDLEKNADIANKASQAKTQFMANMSHELRTPLNGVIGMSGLLLKTEQEVQQRQYTEIINKCAQNLFTIIEDVLDVSKMDADQFVLRPKAFNLSALLQSVVDLNKPSALSSGLKVGMNYSDKLPDSFMGDAKAIRQIVNNLMSNAIKFTEHGSAYVCVEGELEVDDNYRLRISVKDTGVGIAPENVAKIFERFSQLDTRLSREQEGTGLGLALSKKLAEIMGGTLSVMTRPGEGSTFTFEVVLAAQGKVPTQKTDVAYFQPIDESSPVELEAIQPFGEVRATG